MSTEFIHKEEISEFISANRGNFKEKLLSEAMNVRNKIQDILEKGNIDLLKNAENLALFIAENRENELIEFAEFEGAAWAQHSLTLSFKLEWVHAIRRTLWYFLYQYEKLNTDIEFSSEEFFDLERQINDRVDQFLNTFFISYSDYKDEQLLSQRKLVENLSVPIIPINSAIAVLPLIGMIDSHRVKTLEEKVLKGISSMGIQTLIIDLSGIAEMELDVIVQFEKILNGIKMLGCRPVITGLRVELVRKMINAGVQFESNVETKGTLQQTLSEHLVVTTEV
ncbi:STAS domain-containing protein [Rossellomorea vietnamensis]|uniref:STAS domain-containing protein n=1 Tax=Rossellomorea vietnamensis TaxID=218284 RepID=A0A5D4NXR5_9BACI|nr:STAS domain-containing protein [Rossellomorea vietnamensis]TYS18649.1 STAS domain-containing protein [Rossellomorea vietnamensis]